VLSIDAAVVFRMRIARGPSAALRVETAVIRVACVRDINREKRSRATGPEVPCSFDHRGTPPAVSKYAIRAENLRITMACNSNSTK